MHEDKLGQSLVNVSIIDNYTYMILNVYLDPDLDSSAVATLERISTVLKDAHQRFTITHTIVGGDLFYMAQTATQQHGNQEQKPCSPHM